MTVTVEATLQWAWLHDRLTQAGFPVRVAHPQQVELISHARCKTDPIDARKLAGLTRANLVPTIWVPPPEIRGSRQLVRARATLVRLRTRAKNRIHACLAAENCRVPTTDLFGWGGRAWGDQATAFSGTCRQPVRRLTAIKMHRAVNLRGS